MAGKRYKVDKRSSFGGLVVVWAVVDTGWVASDPRHVVGTYAHEHEARQVADSFNGSKRWSERERGK